jgi:two-component system, response regulator
VSGIEVLRRVKGDPRTRLIPVVVLTGSHDPAHLDACYEQGVNSYVVKPVDDRRFRSVVEAVGRYWVRLNEPPSV